ncbi:MAG: N-acetyl-gamma-glutamyl-phosphate reductase [Desulfurococcales archaeon]|nr:N-acetyl-gamma-glutamyl-phosphate reductase [Desulfurococcales archaeon]
MVDLAKIAVLGGSGYTGGELLRLLSMHSEAEVVLATSREYAGKPIHYAHPGLHGVYRGLKFSRVDIDRILEADVVFNALPHRVGAELTGIAVDAGIYVVDLSADYRLRSLEVYEKWYGKHPRPDLLGKSAYGLPEINRSEIKSSKFVSSPGCNATATILAAAPLAAAGLIGDSLVSDVKAGSSEGGSKPSRGSHHSERTGSVRPYTPGGHRHQAEVKQELERISSKSIRVSLIPHAVPVVRGALASIHTFLDSVDPEEVASAYTRFYINERFIRLTRFSALKYPDVKNVVGSNFADIGYAVDSYTGRVSGFAAIDNLVKGAAGQAVQNMNIMLGLPEDEGLRIPPLRP